MSAYWVTKDVTFTCSATAVLTVSTAPSTVLSIDNIPVYTGNITVIVPSGAQQGGGTLINPVSITLTATSLYSTSENKKILLSTATGTGVGSFQVGESTSSMTITLSIASAGQTVVSE